MPIQFTCPKTLKSNLTRLIEKILNEAAEYRTEISAEATQPATSSKKKLSLFHSDCNLCQENRQLNHQNSVRASIRSRKFIIEDEELSESEAGEKTRMFPPSKKPTDPFATKKLNETYTGINYNSNPIHAPNDRLKKIRKVQSASKRRSHQNSAQKTTLKAKEALKKKIQSTRDLDFKHRSQLQEQAKIPKANKGALADKQTIRRDQVQFLATAEIVEPEVFQQPENSMGLKSLLSAMQNITSDPTIFKQPTDQINNDIPVLFSNDLQRAKTFFEAFKEGLDSLIKQMEDDFEEESLIVFYRQYLQNIRDDEKSLESAFDSVVKSGSLTKAKVRLIKMRNTYSFLYLVISISQCQGSTDTILDLLSAVEICDEKYVKIVDLLKNCLRDNA